MLPLTLRPTDIGTPPAFQHLKDYCVYEDGEEIGRIYETHAPSRPGLAWFWSLYLAQNMPRDCPNFVGNISQW